MQVSRKLQDADTCSRPSSAERLKKGLMRSYLKGLVAVFLFCVGALSVIAQPADPRVSESGPVGTEFQINTYTTLGQSRPAVAVSPDGDFLVVWTSAGSLGTDSSSNSAQWQRFAADGSPVGSEFQINTYTTGGQGVPQAAFGANGDFVVAWESLGSAGSDTDGYSIQARLFAADGSPLGVEFQVNSYTPSHQTDLALAVDADGDFVVVWTSPGSNGSDSDGYAVLGQRFAADGMPQGGEFQVNTYTTSNQFAPEVAMDSSGNFVVVWSSRGSAGTDSSGVSIQAQRFAADGSALGGEIQVNSYTTANQVGPAVVVDGDGSFVVAWASEGSTGTDSKYHSIQARRFAADGSPLELEFQVNTFTSSYELNASVALDPRGGFTVVWHSGSFFGGPSGPDGSSFSIQGQHLAEDGMPLGAEFQVNSYTTAQQWTPSVASQPNGDLIVVWSSFGSNGTDTDALSVQGQRFLSPTRIFVDGFESGDATAWASTVP